MSASHHLREKALDLIDLAVASQGVERQAMIEEAIRLFHAAQAIEADEPAADEHRSFAPSAGKSH